MKRLKVGVIGCGNMGRHHVRNYHEIEDVDLVAICDPSQETREDLSKKFGINTYESLDKMLAEEPLDAVSIVTPTATHLEVGLKVLGNGIHVLMEKPIADTIERANHLIETAKDNKCVLMVGHIERFNPAVQALKQEIQKGALGEITTIVSKRVGGFPTQIKDANVMIDLAVHDIDIMIYLLEKQPDSVTGHAGQAFKIGREDHAELFLTFGSASGYIQVNWITPIRLRECLVTGSKGYAELNYITQEVTVYKSDVSRSKQGEHETIQFNDTETHNIEVEKKEPLKEELTHFIHAIQTQTDPLVSGEVGRESLKIALNALNPA